MSEIFNVMLKTSLEEYFIQKFIPEFKSKTLSNSKKNELDISLREHLGLIILSYFLQWLNKSDTYRPSVGNEIYDDGAIAELKTGTFMPVEQVYVYEKFWDWKAEEGVKNALAIKDKGREYAKGNTLLIFCNAEGDISLGNIRKNLEESYFETIILIGPKGISEFDFNLVVAKENNTIHNSQYNLIIDENTGVGIINIIQ